jgi:hypothetical protein
LNAKDYYSKTFLLLFFSIRIASLLDPNGEHVHFKKEKMEKTEGSDGVHRVICGHPGLCIGTQSERQNSRVKIRL